MSVVPDTIESLASTQCCIVGAGPAGMVLALLLARNGIDVTLLEAHADFDREFRGDTLHPAILEILDQIGLASRLHELPHVKFVGPATVANHVATDLFQFDELATNFPFVTLMPQERFLSFLADEASRYPCFHLVMKANVQRLVEENGAVRGVRYRGSNGWQEVRATLTIAADGRFSRLRHLAGIEPKILSPPMELFWFRLPRLPGDETEFASFAGVLRGRPILAMHGPGDTAAAFGYRGPDFIMLVIDRIDHWQIGYIYRRGRLRELREAGLHALKQSILAIEPRFARHLASLSDWHQLSPLSVAFSRCRRWYKPGLLLIGDAAHVMTPAAGAGIKYAIEDAVATANLLTEPLRAGRVRSADLAAVQRRREWPTRIMQAVGAFAQKNLLARAVRRRRGSGPARVLLPLRVLPYIPLLRKLPARFIAFGVWRERIAAKYIQPYADQDCNSTRLPSGSHT